MPHYKACVVDLPEKTRLFFDGEDVTDCACECDTDEQWVELYDHRRDASGKVELVPDFVKQEVPVRRRHGAVELRPA